MKTNSLGVILARFQPIHNGHMELIKKAMSENENVLILIGSADKIGERNPIPAPLRMSLVEDAIKSVRSSNEILSAVNIAFLDDLTTEEDNSHEWGFYLYSKIVGMTNRANFTIYYSDGYEIITKWFPGFILRNNVSLSLLARNSISEGISATKVREMILSDNEKLKEYVPQNVYDKRDTLKIYIQLWNSK